MGCCGDRRAELSQTHGLRTRPHPYPVEAATPSPSLTYQGPLPMILSMPGSTRIYRLSTPDELVEVDPQDRVALLRTGWFVIATRPPR